MKLRVLTALGVGLLYAQISAAAQPNESAVTHKSATQTKPATTAANTNTTAAGVLTQKQEISYSIGVDLGQNFKAQGIDIDPTMLERGLKDALSGSNLLLTPQQMATTLINFQKELIAKRQAEFNTQSQKNEQEGMQFLAANKSKSGIITTPSGLQYKVITAGKGANPTNNDVVTVDYSGNFINGKIFDSSYQRGKPVTFQVSEVIPGWTEALKLMKPGATYEIYLPYTLAYGERGLGNVIGPKQTLVFKIHLISVKNNEVAQKTTTQ